MTPGDILYGIFICLGFGTAAGVFLSMLFQWPRW